MDEQWDCYPDHAPEVIAVGGDLEPPTLLAAYRGGVFPWPSPSLLAAQMLHARYARAAMAGRIRHRGSPGWTLPWFAPYLRAVLLPDKIEISRSLRTTLRRSDWTTSLNLAFDEVVSGCADRPRSWITPEMALAYSALHRAGCAHSIEVWSREGELIGGLYGVQVGAVFCGESMFHRVSDASKVALLDLAARMRQAGGVLIDSQSPTEHLIRVGQRVVPRRAFRAMLRGARDQTVELEHGRMAAHRLITERSPLSEPAGSEAAAERSGA